MKKNFIALISLFLMILLLAYPEKVSSAVISSVKLCAFTVLPSLFPFAVITNVMINVNLFSADGLAAKLFSKIFNCHPRMFPVFLSGIAGGYPVAAISASEMCKNGLCSKYDARKALSFCCFGGPSFIITAFGVSMLGNIKCGIFLYICHLISGILTGVIMKPYFLTDKVTVIPAAKSNVSFSRCLTSALKNSVASMLSVCACIIFFSAVTTILTSVKIDSPYITAILEMTTGTKALISSDIPTKFLLPSLSACLAFGGLSVHAQVLSVCEESDIDTAPFFTGKITHAVISFIITLISQNLIDFLIFN